MPKQFCSIGNRTVTEYTVENAGNAQRIDEIYLVVNSDFLGLAETIQSKYPKISKIVESGLTKNDSIRNSILALENDIEKAIMIPAVRPFVTPQVFDDYVGLLDVHRVVAFCTPVLGYAARVADKRISEILDRRFIRIYKSPVGYDTKVLTDLVETAPRKDFLSMESDLELVLKHLPDTDIFLYESEAFNYKITYEGDITLASRLLLKDF